MSNWCLKEMIKSTRFGQRLPSSGFHPKDLYAMRVFRAYKYVYKYSHSV